MNPRPSFDQGQRNSFSHPRNSMDGISSSSLALEPPSTPDIVRLQRRISSATQDLEAKETQIMMLQLSLERFRELLDEKEKELADTKRARAAEFLQLTKQYEAAQATSTDANAELARQKGKYADLLEKFESSKEVHRNEMNELNKRLGEVSRSGLHDHSEELARELSARETEIEALKQELARAKLEEEAAVKQRVESQKCSESKPDDAEVEHKLQVCRAQLAEAQQCCAALQRNEGEHNTQITEVRQRLESAEQEKHEALAAVKRLDEHTAKLANTERELRLENEKLQKVIAELEEDREMERSHSSDSADPDLTHRGPSLAPLHLRTPSPFPASTPQPFASPPPPLSATHAPTSQQSPDPEVSTIRSNLNAANLRLQQRDEELQALRVRLHALETETDDREHEIAELCDKHTHEMQQMERTIKQLNGQLFELRQSSAKPSDAEAELRALVEQLQQKRVVAKTRKREAIDQLQLVLQETREELQEELDSQTLELNALLAEKEKLLSEKEELHAACARDRDALTSLRLDMDALRVSVTKHQATIATLEAQNADMRRAAQLREDERWTLVNVQSQLLAVENERDTLRREMDELKLACEQIKKDCLAREQAARPAPTHLADLDNEARKSRPASSPASTSMLLTPGSHKSTSTAISPSATTDRLDESGVSEVDQAVLTIEQLYGSQSRQVASLSDTVTKLRTDLKTATKDKKVLSERLQSTEKALADQQSELLSLRGVVTQLAEVHEVVKRLDASRPNTTTLDEHGLSENADMRDLQLHILEKIKTLELFADRYRIVSETIHKQTAPIAASRTPDSGPDEFRPVPVDRGKTEGSSVHRYNNSNHLVRLSADSLSLPPSDVDVLSDLSDEEPNK
eukprot:gnl/Spiro4/556_TR316_c0_g1_i1.p1 gnl/Spiro4/556_TR316_c0_g1~~gnl/Spiro4/556_TR316_c0_g1_i1.p1  ORF type:complete len:868 (+),score=278.36 gnl/Spiro4/556_TR316_c0_g1_i1:74-2677(+)